MRLWRRRKLSPFISRVRPAPPPVRGAWPNDVVGQAVQDGAGEAFRSEHFGPFVEGQVGCDDDGAALVALRDDLEEQFGAGLAEGDEAQLVDGEAGPWPRWGRVSPLNAGPGWSVVSADAAGAVHRRPRSIREVSQWRSNGSLIPLARTAEPVLEQVVRLQLREGPGAFPRSVAENPRHSDHGVIVEDRQRNAAKECQGRIRQCHSDHWRSRAHCPSQNASFAIGLEPMAPSMAHSPRDTP